MKTSIFALSILILSIYSCAPKAVKTNAQVCGTITEIKGDTLTVNGHKFKLIKGTKQKIGDTICFYGTPNRKAVNSTVVWDK